MKKRLFLIILLLWFHMIYGCVGGMQQKVDEDRLQMQDVKYQVAATGPETFKRSEYKAVIQRPINEVFQTTLTVTGARGIGNESKGATRERTQVEFADYEPIYHKGKVIQTSAVSYGNKPVMGNPIIVTVYLEAQGPNATAVYYYPHHKLYTNIPREQQDIVDLNMQYRGNQFFYRLETQTMCQQKWSWLRK